MSETEQIDTLKALQTRIREATGPDRHLDVEIAKAFGLPQARKSNASIAVPRFTTDPDGLGACVALMREVLPGWSRHVDATAPECGIDVELFAPGKLNAKQRCCETHDLETHAFLLAIITARLVELEATDDAEIEAKERVG